MCVCVSPDIGLALQPIKVTFKYSHIPQQIRIDMKQKYWEMRLKKLQRQRTRERERAKKSVFK